MDDVGQGALLVGEGVLGRAQEVGITLTRGQFAKVVLMAALVHGKPGSPLVRSWRRGAWIAGTWEQAASRDRGEGGGREAARRSTLSPTVMLAALVTAFSRWWRINSTVTLMIRLASSSRFAVLLRDRGVGWFRARRGISRRESGRCRSGPGGRTLVLTSEDACLRILKNLSSVLSKILKQIS
jgi:hypothetical protein